MYILRVNQNINWQPRKVKTVTHRLLLIRVDTKGTCCNIMASRAWATEVESANVRLVKVANKVFPKHSLYIVDNSDVTLGKVHRW